MNRHPSVNRQLPGCLQVEETWYRWYYGPGRTDLLILPGSPGRCHVSLTGPTSRWPDPSRPTGRSTVGTRSLDTSVRHLSRVIGDLLHFFQHTPIPCHRSPHEGGWGLPVSVPETRRVVSSFVGESKSVWNSVPSASIKCYTVMGSTKWRDEGPGRGFERGRDAPRGSRFFGIPRSRKNGGPDS